MEGGNARYGKDLSLKWTTRTGTRVIGEGSVSDSLKDNLFYYGLTILVE